MPLTNFFIFFSKKNSQKQTISKPRKKHRFKTANPHLHLLISSTRNPLFLLAFFLKKKQMIDTREPDIKDAYEFLQTATQWTDQQVRQFVPAEYRHRQDLIRHIASQDPKTVFPMYWLYQQGKFIIGYYCAKDVAEDSAIYCRRGKEFQFTPVPLEATMVEDIRFLLKDVLIHNYELQRQRA